MTTANGVLRIKRHKAFIGVAIAFSVIIDNVEDAKIRNGQEINLQVPVGRHTIQIRYWQQESPKVLIDMQQGQTVELECGIDWNTSTVFLRKSPEPELIRSTPQIQSNDQNQSTQSVREKEHENTIEVYAEDEFPIDNRFGGEPLSVEHEVSKTASNDLSIEIKKDWSFEGGVDISFVKAQISANISKLIGHNIGESITRKQRFTFTVKPGEITVYKIIWKRKVRSGEYLINIDHSWMPITYRMEYDLIYEVQTGKPSS